MRRSAWIFFIAIFVPSLLLGWLALRTAVEQRVLIERQAADLHQAETDAVAFRVKSLMEERQAIFAAIVRDLVAKRGAAALAENYDARLTESWDTGGVPFAISPQGALAFPTVAKSRDDDVNASFLRDNRAFLSNASPAEIYQAQQAIPVKPESKVQLVEPKDSNWQGKSKKMEKVSESSLQLRNIRPQREEAQQQAEVLPSKLAPELSNFQTAVSGASQGILARFVQDELQVLFWTRPELKADWIFGVMLGPEQLNAIAKSALESESLSSRSVRIAIINDKARPVARVPAGFEGDWKRPFVATEIGEVLPHWEVALYLSNPGQLTDSARLITLTLILLIALALAAILAGGYFVAADTRRQLALAQKKTDFVSNVSHELKTPLTSIRMFADLLAEGRVTESEKRDKYLRIISSESERLTRLVNNVLDFARIEKHRKVYEMREANLHAVTSRIWEIESGRLREAGFVVHWDAAPGPYEVVCDADGISQILVNLISNAEKYATRRREITLRTTFENGWFEAEIQDRGPGVPRGLEDKIFEAFFRADDSLSSGVQGSGLGLTLARRIARDHGGDVTCRNREGGGAIFTLRIPHRPPIHP